MLEKDPKAREAYEKARAELNKQLQGICENGNCVEYRDPETGEYRGGWGPVGCGCQEGFPVKDLDCE